MAAMAKWIIDSDHSVVAFSVRHMMIAHVRGQFNRVSGVVMFDPKDIAGSSVELRFDPASVITGIQKRDEHLKSADFFDIKTFPEIVFKSTNIDYSGGTKADVTGNLTLHGITRPIILSTEFFGPVKDPFGTDVSMGFTATCTIKRKDYGMEWNQLMADNGLMLGWDIELFIDLEADQASG